MVNTVQVVSWQSTAEWRKIYSDSMAKLMCSATRQFNQRRSSTATLCLKVCRSPHLATRSNTINNPCMTVRLLQEVLTATDKPGLRPTTLSVYSENVSDTNWTALWTAKACNDGVRQSEASMSQRSMHGLDRCKKALPKLIEMGVPLVQCHSPQPHQVARRRCSEGRQPAGSLDQVGLTICSVPSDCSVPAHECLPASYLCTSQDVRAARFTTANSTGGTCLAHVHDVQST